MTMKRLATLFLAVVLSACGGGGDDAPAGPTVNISWAQSTYTLVRNPSTTASVQATVFVSGTNLPPIIGVNITPGNSGGPGPNGPNQPWFVNNGAATGSFSVQPEATPGSYPISARVIIDNVSYTANATLVVQ